ncbi:MAG: tRNA guanosine(34) transglycosylase Tgt [Candidatus Nomurabacteria bacterium]|jgi:queuine tRNA-ribosyltransferase|nr:tRNA guanosine(34) transglycosylase Tgt [Candidatus Nomurabacteria bacterium]
MSDAFYFEPEKILRNGLGRAGVIHTPHGDIKTPTFAVVGTRGFVRSMPMEKLRELNAQAMLSNGYHLRRQADEISTAGGLAAWSGWDGPTITDSGGFQIMSLGSGLGKVVSMNKKDAGTGRQTPHEKRLAKITEDGVYFTDPWDGQEEFMGPEESMRVQHKIGADIMMAFDELTSIGDSYEYNMEAMERTHRWAERCLMEHKKLGGAQALYGVLQGGHYEDLRRETAKILGGMDFDGFGLGGAFLKEDLGKILEWVAEELPFAKPRHLLGLSRPDDIFVGAEFGCDTFDCVAPTREARHGRIYTLDGDVNLRKGIWANVEEPLDEGCDCGTCREGWTRGKLRVLLKSQDRDEKERYFELASVHNVRFIVRLTEQMRESILEGEFEGFRDGFLKRYYSSIAWQYGRM